MNSNNSSSGGNNSSLPSNVHNLSGSNDATATSSSAAPATNGRYKKYRTLNRIKGLFLANGVGVSSAPSMRSTANGGGGGHSSRGAISIGANDSYLYELPPHQYKNELIKKMNQCDIEIGKQHKEREGLIKLRDFYSKNDKFGDSNKADEALKANEDKLGQLTGQLAKYRELFSQVESSMASEAAAGAVDSAAAAAAATVSSSYGAQLSSSLASQSQLDGHGSDGGSTGSIRMARDQSCTQSTASSSSPAFSHHHQQQQQQQQQSYSQQRYNNDKQPTSAAIAALANAYAAVPIVASSSPIVSSSYSATTTTTTTKQTTTTTAAIGVRAKKTTTAPYASRSNRNSAGNNGVGDEAVDDATSGCVERETSPSAPARRAKNHSYRLANILGGGGGGGSSTAAAAAAAVAASTSASQYRDHQHHHGDNDVDNEAVETYEQAMPLDHHHHHHQQQEQDEQLQQTEDDELIIGTALVMYSFTGKISTFEHLFVELS